MESKFIWAPCIQLHSLVVIREKGRVAKEGVVLPSQLERTLQLGWCGLHRVHLLLCPSKIFEHGNKKLFSL
jgi:hypothetical protein